MRKCSPSRCAPSGGAGDVALAISTSGNAVNVLRAVGVCRRLGVRTVALTGGNGGKLAGVADLVLRAGATTGPPRIQETHILVGHVICEQVDVRLFGAGRGSGGEGLMKRPASRRRRSISLACAPTRCAARRSKVAQTLLGHAAAPGMRWPDFLRGLPDILAARDFLTVARGHRAAPPRRQAHRPRHGCASDQSRLEPADHRSHAARSCWPRWR